MIRRTLSNTKAATFSVHLPDSRRGQKPAGTGFFVSPDGWFVTAAHVVTENSEPAGPVRADLAQMWLMQETRIPGGPPGAMCQNISFGHILPKFDLALLKADFAANSTKAWLTSRSDFPFLSVSSRVLEEGEPVYSFGYPLSSASAIPGAARAYTLALSPRVTSAVVSSTFDVSKMVSTNADARVYVLDRALNYGNSGGPIVSTESGRVHAVCSRFQPMRVPQPHLKDAAGNIPVIMMPSLYGIVSSLANEGVLELFRSLKIPIDST